MWRGSADSDADNKTDLATDGRGTERPVKDLTNKTDFSGIWGRSPQQFTSFFILTRIYESEAQEAFCCLLDASC